MIDFLVGNAHAAADNAKAITDYADVLMPGMMWLFKVLIGVVGTMGSILIGVIGYIGKSFLSEHRSIKYKIMSMDSKLDSLVYVLRKCPGCSNSMKDYDELLKMEEGRGQLDD